LAVAFDVAFDVAVDFAAVRRRRTGCWTAVFLGRPRRAGLLPEVSSSRCFRHRSLFSDFPFARMATVLVAGSPQTSHTRIIRSATTSSYRLGVHNTEIC